MRRRHERADTGMCAGCAAVVFTPELLRYRGLCAACWQKQHPKTQGKTKWQLLDEQKARIKRQQERERDRMRRRREQNPFPLRAAVRACHRRHREQRSAYGRSYRGRPAVRERLKMWYAAYYQAHAEEKKARERARWASHREDLAPKQAAYRAAHREAIRRRAASYRATHRDEINAKQRERRRLKKEQQQDGSMPPVE